MKTNLLIFISLLLTSTLSFAHEHKELDSQNLMDELDPFAENIEEQLEALDEDYEEETGLSPYLNTIVTKSSFAPMTTCYRESCPVYLAVSKAKQRARIYVNGVLEHEVLVSTGAPGHETPNFDTHPDGRIYDRYTSRKFPGGDYSGLGNMPYAVFIRGGFAVHGTAKSNWPKLGRKASHGCVRMHPDNGYIFNRLVREYGVRQTWITIQ